MMVNGSILFSYVLNLYNMLSFQGEDMIIYTIINLDN